MFINKKIKLLLSVFLLFSCEISQVSEIEDISANQKNFISKTYNEEYWNIKEKILVDINGFVTAQSIFEHLTSTTKDTISIFEEEDVIENIYSDSIYSFGINILLKGKSIYISSLDINHPEYSKINKLLKRGDKIFINTSNNNLKNILYSNKIEKIEITTEDNKIVTLNKKKYKQTGNARIKKTTIGKYITSYIYISHINLNFKIKPSYFDIISYSQKVILDLRDVKVLSINDMAVLLSHFIPKEKIESVSLKVINNKYKQTKEVEFNLKSILTSLNIEHRYIDKEVIIFISENTDATIKPIVNSIKLNNPNTIIVGSMPSKTPCIKRIYKNNRYSLLLPISKIQYSISNKIYTDKDQNIDYIINEYLPVKFYSDKDSFINAIKK